jgi:hypothetical protein
LEALTGMSTTVDRILGTMRFFYFLANGFAGIVLILIVIDPTRNLSPVFVLLALAVVCVLVPWYLRRKQSLTNKSEMVDPKETTPTNAGPTRD